MNKTITVLTLDLSPNLAERLRLASQDRPGSTLRDIALEALEEWLDRREDADTQTSIASEDGPRASAPRASP